MGAKQAFALAYLRLKVFLIHYGGMGAVLLYSSPSTLRMFLIHYGGMGAFMDTIPGLKYARFLIHYGGMGA